MKIYRNPAGLISIGISVERAGIYDESTGVTFRILHFKLDFLFWHLHWEIRITKKTRL